MRTKRLPRTRSATPPSWRIASSASSSAERHTQARRTFAEIASADKHDVCSFAKEAVAADGPFGRSRVADRTRRTNPRRRSPACSFAAERKYRGIRRAGLLPKSSPHLVFARRDTSGQGQRPRVASPLCSQGTSSLIQTSTTTAKTCRPNRGHSRPKRSPAMTTASREMEPQQAGRARWGLTLRAVGRAAVCIGSWNGGAAFVGS